MTGWSTSPAIASGFTALWRVVWPGVSLVLAVLAAMGASQMVLPGASVTVRETWMLRKPVDWAKLKGVLPLQ